jgi:serine/threonine protein kinase
LIDSAKGYTNKVDVWAAGIVLVMLLTGYHPFSECSGSTATLLVQILNGEQIVKELITKQVNISEEAKDLVCSMVKIDPR